ncbi:MAG: alpha amylase C-terminal domain-containing protein [Bacteroidales bacterium]|nr:alpha amylase C-terminal domain-containing protein [Bacteroidales bacterium]
MNLPEYVKKDPWLLPYAEVIVGRQKKYHLVREELTGPKSLVDFAQGHHYFGLHKKKKYWVFREWGPNASGIFFLCESSGWQESAQFSLRAQKNGVWELRIPLDKLRHGDLYHLSVHWEGGQGERIPSYATRVVQDENTKLFNAQVWDPSDPYLFKVKNFRPSEKAPFIYEAHIGMSSEEEKVASYSEFRDHLLPYIIKAGYNTIQLMAIQEHPYYGSFGYHVSSFFAASSRFGTPDELKSLIDTAHANGIRVIMDIVHSHAVRNEVEGLALFDGTREQYFHPGPRGEHPAWNSLCFNYGKHEVLHFLLSNCRYWLEEYQFDGFRFDGVTSMLYLDHGLGRDFTSYDNYYNGEQDEDAIIYLTLANELIHHINPQALTVAEEMSGMPGLAVSNKQGGLGFDYRLAMGVPDYWIKLIKEYPDEQWNVNEMYHELSNHREDEKTIGYAESHDQALVGDKTIAFRLMDKEMYFHMSKEDRHIVVDRGIALHKMIRLITAATAGGGYLNFMGNEFGHPEWIDFPREGNNWSYKYARRQWHLVYDEHLHYCELGDFDRNMIMLLRKEHIYAVLSPFFILAHEADQVVAFSRKDLLFVFNFNPVRSFTDYGIPVGSGHYRIVLNTDAPAYGGHGRIDETLLYPAVKYGKWHSSDPFFIKLYLPARTGLVFRRILPKPVH